MDATKLENMEDNSISSISSLCALEHFGLGRYGDEVNPEGCFEAFDAIQRVTVKTKRIALFIALQIQTSQTAIRHYTLHHICEYQYHTLYNLRG